MNSHSNSLTALAAPRPRAALRYGGAVAACLSAAAVATPLRAYLDLANIAMLFLLAVLLVARHGGRGPAILAAALSVAVFDFFFVPPRFSFAVADFQYLVTLGVMLAVALITAQLTTGLQLQADRATRQEREARLLYALARDLAGAASIVAAAETAERFLHEVAGAHGVVLLPDAAGALVAADGRPTKLAYVEERLAHAAFERGEIIRSNMLADTGQAVVYLPLKAPMRVRGTLAVSGRDASGLPAETVDPLLTTVASLVAVVVERLHYVDVASRSEVEMASERLRNSILSALSHDVRTPLTALVGLADSLVLTRPPLPEPARETAAAIREQAARMSGMASNLLDMARLAAGKVMPRKEWQLIEEVVGAGVRALGPALARHRIVIDLPPDLPLIEFDAVLTERVVCNLLENAAKYAPPGSTITISGRIADGFARIDVVDEGPGFPEGRHENLFGAFVRGEHESSAPGTGLGLAICRAIVEAHGGTIGAASRPEGGARVSFTLPLGSPPAVDEEPEGPQSPSPS
jgi:two-component system, OmpR family, sensor histidine kinase KdpD